MPQYAIPIYEEVPVADIPADVTEADMAVTAKIEARVRRSSAWRRRSGRAAW